MKPSLVITGIDKIDRKLKMLPIAVQKKVVRPAMRAGLKIIAGAIEDEAPKDSGLMASSVKVRATKNRKRGSISLEAQISGKVDGLIKTDKESETTFYPAVVQYGRKGVAADPFVTRAYTSTGEIARQVTIERLEQGVDREVAKL